MLRKDWDRWCIVLNDIYSYFEFKFFSPKEVDVAKKMIERFF